MTRVLRFTQVSCPSKISTGVHHFDYEHGPLMPDNHKVAKFKQYLLFFIVKNKKCFWKMSCTIATYIIWRIKCALAFFRSTHEAPKRSIYSFLFVCLFFAAIKNCNTFLIQSSLHFRWNNTQQISWDYKLCQNNISYLLKTANLVSEGLQKNSGPQNCKLKPHLQMNKCQCFRFKILK